MFDQFGKDFFVFGFDLISVILLLFFFFFFFSSRCVSFRYLVVVLVDLLFIQSSWDWICRGFSFTILTLHSIVLSVLICHESRLVH